jgi:hypothetical protein
MRVVPTLTHETVGFAHRAGPVAPLGFSWRGKMHPRTIVTLQELENAVWFSQVGVKDTEGAVVLSSWQEAVTHCGSIEWENLCLEAANQYRERLLERSKERFEKWNEIASEIRKITAPLVSLKIKPVIQDHSLPKAFENAVRWDILHLCMESEYADVYPPGFFAGNAYWYAKGHFPCGWKGVFPDGMPIIY